MLTVSHVRFESVPDRGDGLIGFADFNLGDVRICGVAVRRTRLGRHALSFPRRRDRAGTARPVIWPTTDHARRHLEAQVLGALGLPYEDGP